MGANLGVPQDLAGFGNLLVWLLATRATDVVDRVYASGLARPTAEYRMRDGHHLPTPSVIGWLILACEHEATLAARQRVLGPDHPDTMRSRHALAVTYFQQGRYAEAIALHEVNLAERTRVLGEDNPNTRLTVEHLAQTRAAAGQAG